MNETQVSQTPQTVPLPPPVKPPESIINEDKAFLELAKMKRQLALKEAEKALAQNESAGFAYQSALLQLYVKYGLSMEDSLDEQTGIITRKIKGE
jgi:hypothetical protein